MKKLAFLSNKLNSFYFFINITIKDKLTLVLKDLISL